jgi:catechol 2,3-dioxygenase-like lactoylglutathione lyase family enzyme
MMHRDAAERRSRGGLSGQFPQTGLQQVRMADMIAKLAAGSAIAAGLLLGEGGAAADSDAPKTDGAGKGHITGIGGIFFKSKDPKALSAWYRDTLGLNIENWGGAMLSYEAPEHPPVVVWSPFPDTTGYLAPSTREFMINFAVDDLDAFLAGLTAKGVSILKRDDQGPQGKFAWILDPDGTKIELWEPKRP